MEGEFDPTHFVAIHDTVARIEVANVCAFGLSWKDCEQLLAQLGYSAKISIVSR